MSDSDKMEVAESIYEMPSRKAILQYLVRMGSFTSTPKIPNEDMGDMDVIVPTSSSWGDLYVHCQAELSDWPSSISRNFITIGEQGRDRIRVMQWNILAQALADGSDHFIKCPPEAVLWQYRRWRLLIEIISMQPDVLCMQEVDHFKFFERVLASVGFTGVFCPKPDSPCLYIPDNNGPDGCALFINTNNFEISEVKSRCLEVWGCQTNQVAILCKLRRRSDNSEMWIGTTHLKARPGPFLAALRREQGCDLLDFIKRTTGDKAPLLLTGDMNANPTEPVHSILRGAEFESAYHNIEPSYTTWTIREDGEHCKTLDYIFYRKYSFQVEQVLQMPDEEAIGPSRVPSDRYPSDHFALVVDVVLQSS